MGNVLVPYDCDQSFPVYGFGGKLDENNQDYCFPLNGNSENPQMQGLNMVLETYREKLPDIKFMKNTKFAPVLQGFLE